MNISIKKLFLYSLVLPVMGSIGVGLISSCSDTWDDHYDETLAPSDKSLLQLIEEDENLSDFLKVLKVTHLYNNNHSTPVTYAQLLDADQSLTVWAPKNGTFNVDSLLKECESTQGDSVVGLHFVGNHIAHTLYQSKGQSDSKSIKMYNDKQLSFNTLSSGIVSANIPATNGLLHKLDRELIYNYNIYEGLTSMSDMLHIGQFLKGFEKQELDEDASIQRGIEDGMKVYSDSVMVKKNILYRTFGYINAEDSNYVAFVPTKEAWEEVVKEAAPYFNYGSVLGADSISNYWMNASLMQDLFYNWNIQNYMDSIYSTSYNKSETPEYNVYYKPYDAGGFFSNVSGQFNCSNGTIYYLNTWPFSKEQLYFRPIRVEAERESNLIESKDCTFNHRTALGDSISKNGYLDIVPQKSTSNWTATFEVAGTLAGTYDICVIILPKTVYNPFSRDFKPNKFKATLNYTKLDGEKTTEAFTTELTNNPYVVDTVTISRFTIPVCNYGQQEVTVSLQLQCSMTNREASKYSREMLLDCIYLKPVKKEDN